MWNVGIHLLRDWHLSSTKRWHTTCYPKVMKSWNAEACIFVCITTITACPTLLLCYFLQSFQLYLMTEKCLVRKIKDWKTWNRGKNVWKQQLASSRYRATSAFIWSHVSGHFLNSSTMLTLFLALVLVYMMKASGSVAACSVCCTFSTR